MAERKPSPPAQWARYTEVAFILPGAVLAGYVLGLLGDKYLGTSWMTLGGIILGIVVGFYQLIRLVLKASQE
jgi:F0F1-type ATP synthase assembly protein I